MDERTDPVDQPEEPNRAALGPGIGVALGAGLGIVIGIQIDELALGLVFGAALGIVIGVIWANMAGRA